MMSNYAFRMAPLDVLGYHILQLAINELGGILISTPLTIHAVEIIWSLMRIFKQLM